MFVKKILSNCYTKVYILICFFIYIIYFLVYKYQTLQFKKKITIKFGIIFNVM